MIDYKKFTKEELIFLLKKAEEELDILKYPSKYQFKGVDRPLPPPSKNDYN